MLRGESKLDGVHPDLVKVIRRAAMAYGRPCVVLEGLRTIAQQRKNVARGVSKTLNSRHLTGHAVDIAPLVDGEVPWQGPRTPWVNLNRYVQKAADDLGIPIVWGGSWGWDFPHYELDRKQYPATNPTGDKPYRPKTAERSRVIQGSALAGGGGVGLIGDALYSVEEAQDRWSAGTWVGLLLGSVILAGALYAIYARWDDAGRPAPDWIRRRLPWLFR